MFLEGEGMHTFKELAEPNLEGNLCSLMVYTWVPVFEHLENYTTVYCELSSTYCNGLLPFSPSVLSTVPF